MRGVGTILGRRLCVHPDHGGTRWLHISSFPPHRWNDDGTIRYVQSYCHSCRNRTERTNYRAHTPDQRLRRNEYERRHHAGLSHPAPERVAVESFRPHWEKILRGGHARFRSELNMDAEMASSGTADGRFDRAGFLVWAGISIEEFENVVKAMGVGGLERQALPLDVCDRVLCAAGLEHVVASLYTVGGRGIPTRAPA